MSAPLQNVNGAWHQADSPPEVEDFKNGTIWYKEYPRMIMSYHKQGSPMREKSYDISAFVNMDFQPTADDVLAFLQRGMVAIGLQGEIVNLRLNNWSGKTNTFWYANLKNEVIE